MTERPAEVEITVDRPAMTSAVGAYLRLNPDAERVRDVDDEAAVRTAGGAGELLVVKGPVRFFVVVSGGSPTRDALLSLGQAAAGRL